MTRCVFVSDLHGAPERYGKLFALIGDEQPDIVLLGGDLLPAPFSKPVLGGEDGFLCGYVGGELQRLRDRLGERYPRILVILGNDDPRVEEAALLDVAARGLWRYLHGRRLRIGDHTFYGYNFVPPTPFLLKDWERYDVSRYVDPGCVSPEEGHRTMPVNKREVRYRTIAADLERLVVDDDLDRAVMLFHAPPYKRLDRAALDGKMVNYVPLDVYVGSIAIRRFIEERQPLLTLHGHVHESARLTGSWQESCGRTTMLSAAHDGPELAVVRFDLARPQEATRELL